MSGAIAGGWGFVWGAYGISALVFGIYAIRTFIEFRTRRERTN